MTVRAPPVRVSGECLDRKPDRGFRFLGQNMKKLARLDKISCPDTLQTRLREALTGESQTMTPPRLIHTLAPGLFLLRPTTLPSPPSSPPQPLHSPHLVHARHVCEHRRVDLQPVGKHRVVQDHHHFRRRVEELGVQGLTDHGLESAGSPWLCGYGFCPVTRMDTCT